jgi:ADP-heptose:LPS heptosyltransferase
MKNFEGKPVKILIVRFSSIGDIVLTTPVIRCLKLQFPLCTIDVLTKSRYRDLLINNPYISQIHCIEKTTSEILEDLKHENYQLIIDLHKNLRTFFLKFRLRKPSVSFHKLNVKKFLMVLLKINRLPQIHIVDRMMLCVKKLGVKYDGMGLDYFIDSDTSLPEHINTFVRSNPKHFAFCIGGTYYTKRCPNEKVIEICKNTNIPVILIGGSEDEGNGDLIQQELGNLCYNACGHTSTDQSALIMQNSLFVISNDTGMMHIAAALKKPVISLWGNTIPLFGMTPFLPEGFLPPPLIAEVKGLTCRPCSKLGFQNCPKKHFNCMNQIDNHGVFDYIFSNNFISKKIN